MKISPWVIIIIFSIVFAFVFKWVSEKIDLDYSQVVGLVFVSSFMFNVLNNRMKNAQATLVSGVLQMGVGFLFSWV